MAMKTQSGGSVGSLISGSTSDLSKSGSSKSDQNKTTQEKEQELAKDNAASPIDMECHIQFERITKIFDDTIYKTKICISIPDLVQEHRILKKMLIPQHMDDLIFIYDQYESPLFSSSLLDMVALEDIKSGDMSLKKRLNPELAHILYILKSYRELRPIIEVITNKKVEEYLRQEPKETVWPIEYLLAFEHWRNLMVKQMTTTAAEELALKFHKRKLENANAKHLQKIEECTTALKKEQALFEKAMTARANTIAQLEEELSILKKNAELKLEKKVLDSNRQMVLMTRRHNLRNEMLKEEEQETREGYENTLRTHLTDEKAHRMRRFKVETQLLSWLQKYDLEMSDKQLFLDDVEMKYEDEKAKVEKFTIDLEEQDKEYIPLMAERSAEYHEEMKAKMDEFLIDHAARVIQTAWRQVLSNRHEKRKLKAIWKKMKEARERAERIQERREAEERKAAEDAERAKKKKKEEKEGRI